MHKNAPPAIAALVLPYIRKAAVIPDATDCVMSIAQYIMIVLNATVQIEQNTEREHEYIAMEINLHNA